MSEIVSHTKCQNCEKIFNIGYLQDNPEGIGMICIDLVACKNREQANKNIQSYNPSLKPTR